VKNTVIKVSYRKQIQHQHSWSAR